MTAEYLARTYDLAMSSLWRGDAAGAPFLTWLEQFRTTEPVSIPTGLPRAYSVLGGGGRGVRWYAAGDVVLGVPGTQAAGCYRVPVDATFDPAADLPAPETGSPDRPERATTGG